MWTWQFPIALNLHPPTFRTGKKFSFPSFNLWKGISDHTGNKFLKLLLSDNKNKENNMIGRKCPTWRQHDVFIVSPIIRNPICSVITKVTFWTQRYSGKKMKIYFLPSVLKTEVYSDIISDMQVYGSGTPILIAEIRYLWFYRRTSWRHGIMNLFLSITYKETVWSFET